MLKLTACIIIKKEAVNVLGFTFSYIRVNMYVRLVSTSTSTLVPLVPSYDMLNKVNKVNKVNTHLEAKIYISYYYF